MSTPRFVLSVRRENNDTIRLTASGPAGTAVAIANLSTAELDELRRPIFEIRDWDAARTFGARIFGLLFPREIDELLEESRYRAGERSLTVALDFEDDELQDVPWELAFDPEIERFVSLTPGTPVSRSGLEITPPRPPEKGNLRVRVFAPAINEGVLEEANSFVRDTFVDVSIGKPGEPDRQRSHVAIVQQGLEPADVVPRRTPLAVVFGDRAVGQRALERAKSVVLFPEKSNGDNWNAFLSYLLGKIALGSSVGSAVVEARRAMASSKSASPEDWVAPRFLTSVEPGPVVEPEKTRRILGAKMMEHTVTWVQDSLAGVVSSLVVFLVGLILYRLGVSGSSPFQLDILSPISLYRSFSALMIELSNYRESFLLATAGIFALVTAIVGFLWWRNRVIDPEEATRFASHFAGPLSGLRTFVFMLAATLTVVGSYGYQQYLWRSKLPIPSEAFGIAVTRNPGSDTFRHQLQSALSSTVEEQDVVIRDLPVEFDARDVGTARSIGDKIGAEAAVVFTSDEHGGTTNYVAYIAFAHSDLGRLWLSRASTLFAGGRPMSPSLNVTIQGGVAVPTLRSTSIEAMVESTAGIVDYKVGRIDDAIAHFERADKIGPSDSANVVVDLYRANAYLVDGRVAESKQTYLTVVSSLETRAGGTRLGPQDELMLVSSYLALGTFAAETGDWTASNDWLQKGIAHRDSLLARSKGLDRQDDVNDLYSRVFAQLAKRFEAVGDDEGADFWAKRANDELQLFAKQVSATDPERLVRLSATRLIVGDCTGAVENVNQVLAIQPGNTDAILNAAAIAAVQFDVGTASTRLGTISSADAIGLRAHEELGLISSAFASNLGKGYADSIELENIASMFSSTATPGPLALQELSAANLWLGSAETIDLSSVATDDELTVAKSRVLLAEDPARRQAAIDRYASAIQSLNVLAALRPADASIAAALAGAHAARLGVLVNGSLDMALISSDAGSVRVWAEKVIEALDVSRGDRLVAYALLIESGNDLAVANGDSAPASNIAGTVKTASAEAAKAQPVNELEAIAIRAIYDEAIRFATVVSPDSALAVEAQTARAAIIGPTPQIQALARTTCREERERIAGDALLSVGDSTGAQTSYEASLAANPKYVPALIGLSRSLQRQGNLSEASAKANQATQIATDNPAVWRNLWLIQAASGDQGAANSLNQFLSIVAEQSVDQRLAEIRVADNGLQELVDRDPRLIESARSFLPRLQTALDAEIPRSDDFQLAGRYAGLGSLALAVDAPDVAETLLKRSLDLDSHQPLALTNRAIALLVQGKSATDEIQRLVEEPSADLWRRATIEPGDLLARMKLELDGYLGRFPDRATALQPLASAIDDASALGPGDATPEVSTPSPVPPEVSTPAPATPESAEYHGTTYSFSLTATDNWVISDSASGEGYDAVQFTNGVSTLVVYVVSAPGTSLLTCLQQQTDSLKTDPNVTDMKILVGEDGNPLRGNSPDKAFVAFQYVYTGDDSMSPERVKYSSCEPFPVADVLLVLDHVSPLDGYSEQAEERDRLLETLIVSTAGSPQATPGV